MDRGRSREEAYTERSRELAKYSHLWVWEGDQRLTSRWLRDVALCSPCLRCNCWCVSQNPNVGVDLDYSQSCIINEVFTNMTGSWKVRVYTILGYRLACHQKCQFPLAEAFYVLWYLCEAVL